MTAKEPADPRAMYLKFTTRLEFPALANALCSYLTEDAIDWDHENVYEWMYVDLPELDYSLNISREHGWADIDDDMLDLHEGNDAELKKILKPGPVYVFGWNRGTSDYVDTLPETLANNIANSLAVDVSVFAGRINVDGPDSLPVTVVTPE